MNPLYLIADSSNGGLFAAFGLNLKTFILNTLAFLVVVYILKRFVYPSLMKALDAKQDELLAADRLKNEAQSALEKATAEAHELIAAARATSDDILATTKDEASSIVADSRDKAKAQAERIVADAREQLDRDVEAARHALRAETAELVVAATQVVIGEKLDAKADGALIERSLAGKR